MSERVFYRANFSSATAPTSAGSKQLDKDGNEYAVIPLQLPTDLLQHAREPSKVELLMTKLQVPLCGLPVASLPIDKDAMLMMEERERFTKGIMSIWPFKMNNRGKIYPQHVPEIFTPAGGTGPFPWQIRPVIVPFNTVSGTYDYIAKIGEWNHEKEYQFDSLESLLGILSANLAQVIEYATEFNHREEFDLGQEFFPCFKAENGTFSLDIQNRGCRISLVPWHHELRYPWTEESISPARIMYKSLDQYGGIEDMNYGAEDIYGYSIVVNRYIRDLFPGLPWVKVDNSQLIPIHYDSDVGGYVGQGLGSWAEQNFGDSVMYYLDTNFANLEYFEDDVSAIDVRHDHPFTKTMRLKYSYPTYNLLSAINVSSIVVTLEGMSIISQTLPVNTIPVTASSALTSNIPILEVFYPEWKTFAEVGGNLTIQREAFSNTATISVPPNILHERTLTFRVYYTTKDGKMHILKMPEGSNLCLQLCFALYF